MNWMGLLASLVNSLAWPLVILILVLLFRAQLTTFLGDLSKRRKGSVKAGPLSVEWDGTLDSVRDDLEGDGPPGPVVDKPNVEPESEADRTHNATDELPGAELIPVSTPAAVLEAFRPVERLVFEVADAQPGSSRDIRPSGARPMGKVISDLYRSDVIDVALCSAIRQLRQLRNVAAHASDETIEQDQAMEYVVLADTASRRLRELLPSPDLKVEPDA